MPRHKPRQGPSARRRYGTRAAARADEEEGASRDDDEGAAPGGGIADGSSDASHQTFQSRQENTRAERQSSSTDASATAETAPPSDQTMVLASLQVEYSKLLASNRRRAEEAEAKDVVIQELRESLRWERQKLEEENRRKESEAAAREEQILQLQAKVRELEATPRPHAFAPGTPGTTAGGSAAPSPQPIQARVGQHNAVYRPPPVENLANANRTEALETLRTRMGRRTQTQEQPEGVAYQEVSNSGPPPRMGHSSYRSRDPRGSQDGQSAWSSESSVDLTRTGNMQGKYPSSFHSQFSPAQSPQVSMRDKVITKCKGYTGQMFLESVAKADKPMIKTLKELSRAESAIVPMNLAFAIFRFDLGEVFKWSPILKRDTQFKYVSQLRSEQARQRAKDAALTERLVKEISLHEGDKEAQDVLQEDADLRVLYDRWRSLISLTSLPLVSKYWEPIAPGICEKIKDWLQFVDDHHSSSWTVARKAIDRVLWDYAQQVAIGFGVDFEMGRWQLLSFNLREKLSSEANKIRVELIDEQLMGDREVKRRRVSIPQEKKKERRERRQLSENEKKVREALAEKLGEKFPGFTFSRQMMGKIARHVDPKTKQWGCLFGCGGEIVAKELGIKGARLCEGNCGRSHNTAAVFPEGLKCIKGDCPKTCPSRSENCE